MQELISQLQSRLEERPNPRTKAWWERYLKQASTFRGVKMADIRTSLHAWIEDEQLESRLSLDEQKELALGLLREEVAEDKLAGILFIRHHIDHFTNEGLRYATEQLPPPTKEALFHQRYKRKKSSV